MRSALLFFLLFLLVKPQPILAKSKLKTQTNRRFNRGTVKLVRVVLTGKHLALHWTAPSGVVITYRAEHTPPGVLFKLKRYLKQGYSSVAVGGSYHALSAKTGKVRPEFAYRAKRVWRGVKAVKFDGWMPLFTVTQLPTPKAKDTMIFELRGIINSAMASRDNKLVCVYGTWFDLADYIHPRTKRPRGMVYQIQGIKGPSLFFFPKAYKHPRSWHHMLDPAKKMKALRKSLRRKRRGLPPYDATIRIPLVPQKSIDLFNKRCQQYISAIDKKLSYKPIVLTNSKAKSPATKVDKAKSPATKVDKAKSPVTKVDKAKSPVTKVDKAKSPATKAPTTRPTQRK